MISVAEALQKIVANLPTPALEEIDFREALGCVLAEPVVASCDIPAMNKSAVDGYAVRVADLQEMPAQLECIGEIRAGDGRAARIAPGQAVAIMTGAPVPAGADAVQMVEYTAASGEGSRVVIHKPVRPGENVISAASEVRRGQLVLKQGRLVGPAEIGVLAAFGQLRIQVYRRPRVAVMATGDELVEVNRVPGGHQIRNSNSCSLLAQLQLLGLKADYVGICPDDRGQLRERVLQGLERDVLLVTGGVSVGAYDFVEETFRGLGLDVVFSKVAMRPGKPTVFARKGEKLAFGLPGNPISSFVSFELLVRPALGRLLGLARPDLPAIRGALLAPMKQKTGRTSFLPAVVTWSSEGWKIDPLQWKGSSDSVGFAGANGLVVIPADREELVVGETVDARLLPDYWHRRTAIDD